MIVRAAGDDYGLPNREISMKTPILTAMLAAALLAGCTSGTYVGDDRRSGFQAGVATETQIQAEFGPPTSTASLVGGGKRDVYTYYSDDSFPVDVFPLLALAVGSPWPHTTVVNFDFNPQGVLIASQATRTRG